MQRNVFCLKNARKASDFTDFSVCLHGTLYVHYYMNEQDIKKQYDSIVNLLKEQRLKEAQTQLGAMLTVCSKADLHTRLEQAQTSYQYMLQYMRQGMNDPERDKLYRNLLAETWDIASQAKINILANITGSCYQMIHNFYKGEKASASLTDIRRSLENFEEDLAICQLMPDNLQRLEGLAQQEEENNRFLFLMTWNDTAWTVETAVQAQAFLTSERMRTIDLALFVSAVTLSLTECFDIRKCLWLIDAYQMSNNIINQRALVGLVLTLYLHPDQASLYPELTARLHLLGNNASFRNDLCNVYLQLLQSKETESVDKKMREEIFPEMMKSVSMMRGMKFGFEDPMEENDQNPDWKEKLNETTFNEKLRQMSELQIEGADLHYSSFAPLKSNSFFDSLPNWFYPFDLWHPAIVKLFGANLKKSDRLVKSLLQSGYFCDSDKYSLCLTMMLISPEQRRMMLEQFDNQMPHDIGNEEYTRSIQEYANRREVISQLYIQDIYRFYKCYKQKNKLRDIFKEELALHKNPLFKEMVGTKEALTAVSDFLFRKEHYNEALDIYHELADRQEADADTMQKAGYCLQKEKRYREAIDAYVKADVLKPDHIWTLRHLATCHRQLRNYEQALEYYHKVEAIQPENRNLLFFIGSCLVELQRYDEALQYFFKMDFLQSNDLKAWRAIAWCSLVCAKTEQAERYYEKILATDKAVATDYLNAGHTAWAQGHTDQAAARYGQALSASENTSIFIEMFYKDKDILVSLGISEEDIPLMIDLAL